MVKKNVIIMGAAGRDFHDFNTVFRDNKEYNVVAFTATQIPGIANRKYPKALAGKLYPKGIPIHPEEKLAELIEKKNVDEVVLSYSDLSHREVMNKASIVLAGGADFRLLGPEETMLESKKPVIAVTGVRTGAGKSPTSRHIIDLLKRVDINMRVVVIRHPMPYGVLREKEVERFETFGDLEKHKTTIEEMEEYEPHIEKGSIVYAGVDYGKILKEAEKEADIILWDGGNNDLPFIKPDLHICVADCRRPGDEVNYHPGETNLRMADIVILNKSTSAPVTDVEVVEKNTQTANPDAKIIRGELIINIDNKSLIAGKRVLVVEDGPSLTHGGLASGAGTIAAERNGAYIINPRMYAVGSLKDVYNEFPHLGAVLPAMGYSKKQVKELAETIDKTPCDVVVVGTPIDLRKHVQINKPSVRVSYSLKLLSGPDLGEIIAGFAKKHLN